MNEENRFPPLPRCLRIGFLTAAVLLFISTTTHSQSSILITDVSHVEQLPDFCGEACAEMYLKKLGSALTQKDIFNYSSASPRLGRGCTTPELDSALRAVGFKVGKVWYTVPAWSAKEVRRQFNDMYDDLVKGVPSIVCMRTGSGVNATEHFRLVLGFDADGNSIIYHEPAEQNGSYRKMALSQFLGLWPLHYGTREWTIIRLRLDPGQVKKKAPTAPRYSNADYCQAVLSLKEKVPVNFTVLIEPPFVVVGNDDSANVAFFAQRTVRWAVTHLKKIYFAKDPDTIIAIWLLKDSASYETCCRTVFNMEPGTPFGFYLARANALVMNISTGGGTLVHEIVHPFMSSNFPGCPAWFNEGLGSLYEQSSLRNDTIIGLTNWRLAGLQSALMEKSVPSLKTLLSTTENEFYIEDLGTNYAHARYLCYYLQERGLLVPFYHAFVKNAKEDPTGYKTLMSLLGKTTEAEFREKWEKFVIKLEF
jgi:hypothetical protein